MNIISLWSSTEESWIINPCANCKFSEVLDENLLCLEFYRYVPSRGFCERWERGDEKWKN